MKKQLCLFAAILLARSFLSAADVVNVAENGTPFTSSPLWASGGWDIHMLIDGNTSSVFHLDTTPDAGSSYTLDLGKNYTVQEIRIYPRQDGCCPERLRQIRVSVHNDNAGSIGTELWGTNLFTNGSNAGSVAGGVVQIPLPTPTSARWVEVITLEEPVLDYSLQMTELAVYADVPASEVNRAQGALVTANQPIYAGQQITDLVDGNRANVVHGGTNLTSGFAFDINLGTLVNLTRIVLWPRQDGCCGERLSNLRVSVHNDDAGKIGAAVWSASLHTDGTFPPSDPGTKEVLTSSLDATGTFKGQWIRIESLDNPPPDYALQLAEVEAFGEVVGPANLLVALQPSDTVAGLGQTATFAVGATVPGGDASKITYQWQKNALDIPGATNAQYITPLLGAADDKSKFRCVIAYPGVPSQTSTDAVVRINLAYHTKASTTSPLWVPGGWTIDKLVDGDRAGVFHLDTSPAAGAAYQINLGDAIKMDEIDLWPRQDGCCGERLQNFRVSVHKDNQGQIGDSVWSADLFTDGTNPPSTAGSVVRITADRDPSGQFEGQWIQVKSLDDPVRDYALQMTEIEVYGAFASSAISLSITQNPSDVAAGLGATASLSISAKIINGDPTKITYQWQKNSIDISGATNATYVTPAITAADDKTKFRCVASYPGLSAQTSSEATLRVNYAYHAKTATTSPLWGPGNWSISNLVDGDRSNVFHLDTSPASGAAYQIDLGAPVAMEEIEIWARQDGCCGERLSNFRVSIHNDKNGNIGDPVWTADFFTDGTNPGSARGVFVQIKADKDPAGKFEGQWIQILSLDDPVPDYALQMTELEVYGSSTAPAGGSTISITRTGGQFQLAWTSGQLESATDVRGPFATVANASSPLVVIPNETQRFYRVRQ